MIPKLTVKNIHPNIARVTWKRKVKGRLALPDTETYYKMKLEQCGYWLRNMQRSSRTEQKVQNRPNSMWKFSI